LETILQNNVQFREQTISDLLPLETYHQVKEIFLHPLVTAELPPFKWVSPNQTKIQEILCEKHNFDSERVETALKRLIKHGAATQRSLKDFF
jgi:hypothetical protein